MKALTFGVAVYVASAGAALANGSSGVVVVSPSGDYGQNQVVAVQRVAARFEQLTSLSEVRQVRVSRSDGVGALEGQCAADGGAKVLYVDAATTHDLRPGEFYKTTFLVSVYDCRTRKIANVTRQAAVSGAKGWEDPLIAAGYRSIEAGVIAALAREEK